MVGGQSRNSWPASGSVVFRRGLKPSLPCILSRKVKVNIDEGGAKRGVSLKDPLHRAGAEAGAEVPVRKAAVETSERGPVDLQGSR